MCLYMLGLLVLRDVLEQGLLIREALVTGVALVRLVSLVASRVGLQVGQLREGLGATWASVKVSKKSLSLSFLAALAVCSAIDISDRHSIGGKKQKMRLNLA